MIDTITSLQNPRVKTALRLHSSRGRQAQGRMIVFGDREVERALNAKIAIDEVFVPESVDTGTLESLQTRLPPASQVIKLTSEVYAKLAYGDRTEGMIATAKRPETTLKQLEISEPAMVLVVQAIEKPGNLGAIIRSADAGGVSAIILADPLTDFFHPNSIRSSTGAVFRMPLATGSSPEVQSWLRANRFLVLTAILDNAHDFFETDLRGNLAMVLGNEANGLDQQWSQPDFKAVKLPMKGQSDSLNVSVTASIMIYEAMRQRDVDANRG